MEIEDCKGCNISKKYIWMMCFMDCPCMTCIVKPICTKLCEARNGLMPEYVPTDEEMYGQEL